MGFHSNTDGVIMVRISHENPPVSFSSILNPVRDKTNKEIAKGGIVIKGICS